MNFRDSLFASALALAGTLSCAAPVSSVHAQSAPSTSGPPPALPQITQAINPALYTAMVNDVRPEVTNRTALDQGRVDDNLQLDDMLLLLHRPAQQEQALDAFMAEQTTPGSPNYHHWLTIQQIAAYGPAPSDINTLTSWLQSQGFRVNQVSGDGMTIDFSGTAGQVRAAFKTEIHNLDVDGVAHIANISRPQIPSALAPAVVGIVSLNDFKPHTNFKPKPDYTFTSGGSTFYVLVPADLATIYNLNPLFNTTPTAINGAGQTIILIEDTNVYSTQDITKFRSTFGLPTATFSQVHPESCTNPGIVTVNDGEAELDVEWAGAAAPGATLKLASCKDTLSTFGGLIAMQNLNTTADSARLWSVSYGQCEAFNGATANAAFASTYQTATARGVSVFVSSGDEGAASCDANQTSAQYGIAVSGFASTPYNVAVGGTDFGDSYAGTNSTYWGSANTSTFGSAKSYINEIPWNDSCASQLLTSFIFANPPAGQAGNVGNGTPYGASGFCNSSFGAANFLTTASGSGGPSNCYSGTATNSGSDGTCRGQPKPSWQSGIIGNPGDLVRDIPDVSLFAANGAWGHYYVYCYSHVAGGGAACTTGNPNAWSGAGGTSFSSPIMAGIQALVNQRTGSAQGNPNPTYYSLATAEYGPSGNSACNSSNGKTVASTCVFNDVTQGDMDVNCVVNSTTLAPYNCYLDGATNGVLSTSNNSYSPAYGTTTAAFSGGATNGWDFATGIGTVNACNLVNNWTGTPGSLVCFTVGPAAKLVFTVEPNSSYVSNAPITVKASVEDVNGNVVTTDSSTVSLTLSGGTAGATLGGTASVAAVNGVATFSNLTVDKVGTAYALNATDGSLSGTASTPFNITIGAPASITFTTQPAANANIAAGSAFNVVAHVTDSGGNPIPNDSVTLAIGNNAGGSTLSGGGTVSTDTSGNANFGSVSLNKVGTGYTLTASDGLAPTATSNSFNIVAAAPAAITFALQPGSNANIVAGSTIPLIANVTDSGGNPVPSDSVTLAIGNNAGGSTLSVAANPVVTDASGNATFSNVSLNKVGTGYTLTAADGVAPTATGNAFNIVAGAATQLVFSTQPANIVSPSALNTIAVTEEDSSSNTVTSDSTTGVNFTVSACGGTALGSATMSSGVATLSPAQVFSTLRAGLTVSANDPTLSLSALSQLFNVDNVSPSDLIFIDGFENCTL